MNNVQYSLITPSSIDYITLVNRAFKPNEVRGVLAEGKSFPNPFKKK